MSHHILHLLSPELRVRCELDRLLIKDRAAGTERAVPLQDIAVIISAAPDMSITAGALRRMADLGVLLLICNERFEPACLTLPYYRATNTELLRRQIEWTAQWKLDCWRQVITAKVRHQATVLKAGGSHWHSALEEIARRCESAAGTPPTSAIGTRPPLSHFTLTRRAGLHATTPEACESRAARLYWRRFLPPLTATLGTGELGRTTGTRAGVNGMLDYGYAILRTAVLRSLAAHGFIAAIGIAHAAKAGSHALADDLMEPLRPFMDATLRDFLATGPQDMAAWVRCAPTVLTQEVRMDRAKVRLLHAIDLYVRSFASAALARAVPPLKIPSLSL
ncbi:MAG: CRISPR-associated endonuclease Cas1 [Roseimicrobium sp.]